MINIIILFDTHDNQQDNILLCHIYDDTHLILT